ncbi:hypothetical protein [Pseudoalteromonas sp. McH1-42]|uniref:hypothetical protein n=1 Tax=Pseudoalteromonas sp. McH1-42 TaxID=2917752 RepID=UPI001EF6DE31|nr:hypothetical protein [Pseudoalteromonas sp. McH1-42]MCG7564580.1 hypothetical protein [Pseudoalteromonas sp. McH1-42]
MVHGNERVSALMHPLEANDFRSDKENSLVENVYYMDNDAIYVVQEKISLNEGGYISNWHCFESATGRLIPVEERKRKLIHTQYNYDFGSEKVECRVNLHEANGYETLQCRILDQSGTEVGTLWFGQHHFEFDYEAAKEILQKRAKSIRERNSAPPGYVEFSQRYLSADYDTKKRLLVTSFRQHYKTVGETGLGDLYAFLTQQVYDHLKRDPDFIPLLREIASDPIHHFDTDSADEIFHSMLSNLRT